MPRAGNEAGRSRHDCPARRLWQAQTVPREKIGEVFGLLASEDMLAVGRALAVFLGIV